jgi:Holliday junction resolvase RusA-like endonuclease
VSERAAAAMAEAGYVLFDGPLGLAVTFTRAAAAGALRSGRNAGVVKDSAPGVPVVKPDATKLLRAVEDAMTGTVYRDDAQVVEQFVSKRYGDSEGVKVTVWTL